ncbi:MAG: P-type conjugative transfer protein TrbG [Proteobacteria bacterium]|nr:MAG: P-type conjugative transfer protein TrbG [Pseudomonadota bacterium]
MRHTAYNLNPLLLIALGLALPLRVMAESPQGGAPFEKELLDAMHAAALPGQEVEVAASPLTPWSLPEESPLPNASTKRKSTDQVLKNLVAEVERLQSKEIVTRASYLSTQRPRPALRVGSTTVYTYKEGDIYEAYAAIDRVTDIQLQIGEVLTNPPVSGDTVRWKIGILRSGKSNAETTHLILKPLDTDLETNLVITTNRRVYHLRAISSDWYIPTISWTYPQDEADELAKQIAKQESVEDIQVAPEGLRFDYEIDGGDYEWKPLRVFDDGLKTYLQMPKRLRVTEAPALFVIENGDPMLVNYRVKGDYYIIDRLIEQAQLRVGTNKKVDIYDVKSRPNLFQRIFQ